MATALKEAEEKEIESAVPTKATRNCITGCLGRQQRTVAPKSKAKLTVEFKRDQLENFFKDETTRCGHFCVSRQNNIVRFKSKKTRDEAIDTADRYLKEYQFAAQDKKVHATEATIKADANAHTKDELTAEVNNLKWFRLGIADKTAFLAALSDNERNAFLSSLREKRWEELKAEQEELRFTQFVKADRHQRGLHSYFKPAEDEWLTQNDCIKAANGRYDDVIT